MKLEVKGNINYSCVIVKINKLVSLENCDNIQHAIILGNCVIVSKEVKIGDIGILFPVETKLSSNYLSFSNLYRDKSLNVDKEVGGFFELNGRIRCVKLRGHKSEGLFMPLESLAYIFDLDNSVFSIMELKGKVGESFDTINDIKICEKYVIPRRNYGQSREKKKGRKPKISKIVNNQFRFHIDTEQLGRNLDKFTLNTSIQCSIKIHGSSFIVSNILCKRKLNIVQKLLLKLGIKFETTYYSSIYSSRKVIKNDDINKTQHFYSGDVWGKVNNQLFEFLDKGMTIYGEVCGYLSDNSYIQKNYDYDCELGKFDIYVYRITLTNIDGKIYEFTPEQIQMWCKEKGLKSVIEIYNGTIEKLLLKFLIKEDIENNNFEIKDPFYNWQDKFLEILRYKLGGGIEKRCIICKNNVPFEGIVVRKINTLDFEVYKLKSFLFLKAETEQLDKNEENIEDSQ